MPQHETRCGMDRGESSSLQLLQETTRLDNSGRSMSSTGGLIANNSSSALQLETVIVSEERKFLELTFTLGRATDDKEKLILIVFLATRFFLAAAVLHLHLGFFSWNSFHALRHFLDHESINIKLQSLAHPLWRLTRLATLHAHFTQAYRTLDTLPLSYY